MQSFFFLFFVCFFFFFKQKTAYEISACLVGSEMCIRDRFVHLGKMMEAIKNGTDPKEAYEKNVGTYGRFAEAVEYIDPRHQ